MFLAWCRRLVGRLGRSLPQRTEVRPPRRTALEFEQLEDRSLLNGGRFNFAMTHFTVAENGGRARIVVTRSAGTTTFATVQFKTKNGTAIAGEDYIARAGTTVNSGILSFAPGQRQRVFYVTILNDNLIEGNEFLHVQLMNPLGGATLGKRKTATLTIQDDDGTANQRFVTQAFRDLAYTSISPSLRNHYANLLDQGTSRLQIAELIIGTADFRTAQVRRLYPLYLKRKAGERGLAKHLQMLENGATLEEVQASILGSGQYWRFRGKGKRGPFLKALFKDVLGLPLDQQSRRTYGRMLRDGTSRKDVALMLLTSEAGRRHTLEGLYNRYLARVPTASELAAHFAALEAGERIETIMAEIVGSVEYFNRLA